MEPVEVPRYWFAKRHGADEHSGQAAKVQKVYWGFGCLARPKGRPARTGNDLAWSARVWLPTARVNDIMVLV